MHWAQPIGTGDFALSFSMTADSDLAQLTFAEVALVSGTDGQLEVMGGFRDSHTALAQWRWTAQLRQTGDDASGSVMTTATSAASYYVERIGDQVTLSIDGEVIATGTNASDLTAIAIVTVRYKIDTTEFEFGTATFDDIALCY